MSTELFIRQQLHYMYIADRLVIDAFTRAAKPMPEAEYLFSHILNAQYIWTCRINRVIPPCDRFDPHPVTSFATMSQRNEAAIDEIVQNRALHEPVIYDNPQGGTFTNLLSDILFHIVNHSTHHRGQVASQLRMNQVEPPVTDYIRLLREGKL